MKNRIIIINKDKCKPKTPAFDYLVSKSKVCGKNCITINYPDINISEDACMICFNLAKRTPGNSVKVVNLPEELYDQVIYSYGLNSFKLHRLPMPERGKVIGILGSNGIGKSTALNILSGNIKPNFGLDRISSDKEIIKNYRGSSLQNYFSKLYSGKLKVAIKPQNTMSYSKKWYGQKVKDIVSVSDLMNNNIETLSGGELQRVLINYIASRKADIFIFDEPTSYLDVRQRLMITEVIRKLAENLGKYVFVVEHDLAILDSISDNIHCLYGHPGAFGVVTKKMSTKNGINQFMNGYINSENIRFRSYPLTFKVTTDEISQSKSNINYDSSERKIGSFTLKISSGNFRKREIICLMGQNGCGKTTFIKSVSESLSDSESHKQTVSFKTQEPNKKYQNFKGTVQELLEQTINYSLADNLFRLHVLKPLKIDNIKDLKVKSLSGGEFQLLSIVICLGTKANLYLIDEPSAGLDCEQRMIVAKVIRKWITNVTETTCFLVEHDFLMSSTISNRIVVFKGEPSKYSVASNPISLKNGLNQFLKELNITFRRDPENFRPKINKKDSVKDKEQKISGNYFLI